MTEGPTVDGRDREAVLADLRRRAADYTDEWDPDTEDGGTTLLSLFARFEMDVLGRLNDVPHKHRVAFLEAMGFDRRPPQSARVPLTFATTADIDRNVVVPGGTQVTAETESGGTEVFEIPEADGFEATPATLGAVYAVDPAADAVYDHGDVLEAETPRRLFTGTDVQRHEFYLAHEDLLNVDRGSTLSVAIGTPSSEALDARVRWEYFGEDGDGALGWHPLPPEAEDAVGDPFGEDVGLEEQMRRVTERVRRLDEAGADGADEAVYERTFRFPGPTATSEVAGVESRWIRGRIPGDDPADFDIDVEFARLGVSAGGPEEAESLRPTMAFTNDVPISIDDGDFYPFGKLPHPPTTLYLASEEAFTKRGGVVDVEFAPPEGEEAPGTADGDDRDEGRRITAPRGGPLAGPPEISWEYWNGDGWTRLVLEADETSALTAPGRVRFAVPDDLDATSVSGHDDYWIRARLVGGNYGQPQYEVTSEGVRGELVQRPEPPVYGDVTVRYGQRDAPFEAALTRNNAAFREEALPARGEPPTERGGSLLPFRSLPDDGQTLYLGFDATLRDGPINLYVPMADEAYPSGFEPGIRWEYCPNPAGRTWEKLDVYDGTEGLTERGIVTLNFPTPTTAFELFGERRHWIRARVTRDEFVDGGGGGRTRSGGERGESGGSVETGGDQYTETPPTLEGIHPNTQWAYNEVSVREVVGSSDGSPGQTFDCDRVPITTAEVWVDEAGDLSVTEQRRLERTRPDDVRRESTTGDGDDECWVRWEEASDFLDSGESARHYRLDRTTGTITFGDGRAGAIPPIGEKNVEAVYRTGGGSEGNVPAESILDLRSSISLVDSVTNLEQSDGGTDTESVDEALSRAPKRIKNRGRAVSAADFEQVATAASRELATVKCEPRMNEAGERAPGWVTLLVIPEERRDRPTPSLELRRRVREAVGERAPAALVGHDRSRIVVRGPEYAVVSVRTTVDTRGVESITNLKHTVEETLEEFFHPLSGGTDGEGWAFGTAPRLSRLSTLVGATEGVDRVRDIAMTIETASEEKIVRDPGKAPVLSRDEMVSSGTHEVNVVMRGNR